MSKYIFFSGKGGVGKTTMAATTAVYQSNNGKHTLLVSTDPAGNLGDIFETKVGIEPVQVSQNLEIAQMDSDTITDNYKQRMLEPLSAILDEFSLEQVKEEFNSGCTVEIATFDKFTDFLEDNAYDLIVFDTAPTGHTLRLMTLPGEWDKYIQKSAQGSGQTCIGPVSQIEGARKKYAHAVEVMKDSQQTVVYLVSRPEKTSVYETLRARNELERTGIHHFHLIINGVYPEDQNIKGIYGELSQFQKQYIDELKGYFGSKYSQVPMQQSEVKGVENISLLGEIAFEGKRHTIQSRFDDVALFKGFSQSQDLVSILQKQHENRVVVLTGKGGVGKTVAACSMASFLATRGKTLLLTTDPAAHIGQVLETDVNHTPTEVTNNLWAANIDQKMAVEEYRERILADAKAQGYSEDLLASLEEELESPCTEEIAIFQQFANLLDQPGWDYFVLDTAPTGHTLRLLELPFEYQDQMNAAKAKNGGNVSAVNNGAAGEKIQNLIERLKNKEKASFMLVAYPEFTPLNEGYRAMKDLERVGISVRGVFLNNIVDEQDCPDSFSQERWKLQQHYLHQTKELFEEKPLFRMPLRHNEVIGLDAIEGLWEEIFAEHAFARENL